MNKNNNVVILYRDKVKTITFLRFTSFIIWKILLSMIIIPILVYIFSLEPLSYLASFSNVFPAIIKFEFWSIIVDFIQFLIFFNDKGIIDIFEKIIKGLVDILNIILLSFKYYSLYNCIITFDEIHDSSIQEYIILQNISSNTLRTFFILYILSISYFNYQYYKWPNKNIGRINYFKYLLKHKILHEFGIITNFYRFIVIYIISSIANHQLIDINYTISFLIMFNFFIVYNQLSICMMINFITNPINLVSNGIKNSLDFLELNIDLKREKHFILLQYFKSIELLISNSTLIQNQKRNEILTKKKSFERIYSLCHSYYLCVVAKLNQTLYKIKSRSANRLIQLFDFCDNEIFEGETSIEIIKAISNIIFNTINFLNKVHTNESKDIINKNNPSQIQNNQISYFINLLVYFEGIVKKCLNNGNYLKNSIYNPKYLKTEIEEFYFNLSQKVQRLVIMNIKKNIIFDGQDKIIKRLKIE